MHNNFSKAAHCIAADPASQGRVCVVGRMADNSAVRAGPWGHFRDAEYIIPYDSYEKGVLCCATSNLSKVSSSSHSLFPDTHSPFMLPYQGGSWP
jgi:hypothetical protein